MKTSLVIVALLVAASLLGGCAKQQLATTNSAPAVSQSPSSDSGSETASSVMPPEEIVKPWKGDFDAMAERRIIRALVVYSRMLYFLDGAEQHGVTYDVLKEFENVINRQLQTKALKVHVVFIPVTRDQLQSALLAGRGDIAAANLTRTTQIESVEFSDPLMTGVQELVVAGASAEPIASLDDLAGKEASDEYQITRF